LSRRSSIGVRSSRRRSRTPHRSNAECLNADCSDAARPAGGLSR
jgi:hypothetical protein